MNYLNEFVIFASGFLCGVFIMSVLWYMLNNFRLSLEIVDAVTGEVEKVEQPDKPDNKKVRYYSDPDYRREKAFVEEMNKK